MASLNFLEISAFVLLPVLIWRKCRRWFLLDFFHLSSRAISETVSNLSVFWQFLRFNFSPQYPISTGKQFDLFLAMCDESRPNKSLLVISTHWSVGSRDKALRAFSWHIQGSLHHAHALERGSQASCIPHQWQRPSFSSSLTKWPINQLQ